MFYTRYRPQGFSQILKTSEAPEVLAKQIKDKKTIHAYLFVGPRGTGKTTTARILAKALNCEKLKSNGDPCDKCESCVSIKEASFPDLIEIDAASNRGIDDIRELKDKIRLAPTMGKNKVYIIDEVHMLTMEAFNALLKTLEEPPANTTFILCTTEFHKVPETITSRCQVFKFKRATVKQIVEKLEYIAKEEKLKTNNEELTKIAQASLGGFRDAETLFQQVSEGDLNIDSVLNVGSKGKFIELVSFLREKNSKDALRVVDTVFEEGFDLYVWVGELLKYYRELIFLKSGVTPDTLTVTDEVLEDIKKQVKNVDINWLVDCTNIFIDAHKDIKGAYISQLPIELAVIQICQNNVGNSKKAPVLPKDPVKPDMGDTSTGSVSPGGPHKKAGEKRSSKKKADNSEGLAVSAESNTERVEILEVDVDTDGEPVIAVEEVKKTWKQLLKKSRELNHSITALLKSGKIKEVQGNMLILEVYYKFHKERLECARNRKLIEELLKEFYGVNLGINCVLSKDKPKRLKKRETGVLTDMNVTVPAGVDRDALLANFDGGLPL